MASRLLQRNAVALGRYPAKQPDNPVRLPVGSVDPAKGLVEASWNRNRCRKGLSPVPWTRAVDAALSRWEQSENRAVKSKSRNFGEDAQMAGTRFCCAVLQAAGPQQILHIRGV